MVDRIARAGDGFLLTSADGRRWQSRAVILASGIVLNQVDLPHDVHEAAIGADVLRYCPICDGYEHRDHRIGVIGCDSDGPAEALFLRQYSADITLLPLSHSELSSEQVGEMAKAGIVIETDALLGLVPMSTISMSASRVARHRFHSTSSIQRLAAGHVPN